MAPRLLVGYDASVTLAPGGGGIARYTLELLRALLALNAPDLAFAVLLNSYRHSPGPGHAFLRDPRVRVIHTRLPGPALLEGWRRAGTPTWATLTGQKCRVVHAPASYVPACSEPLVVTVHDLGFLRHGDDGARLGGGWFKQTFPRSLPRAARIITPSSHVANDVANVYAVPRDRIVPIHSGIDARMFTRRPRAEYRPLLERHGIPIPFLLAVTADVPRKRIGHVYKLIQSGMPVWAVGAPSHARHHPHFLPRLTDDELACLYSAADAVVLTTLEEGFGFPLLEALACGTPVVCGRHSSLAEIGGEFPTFLDHDDVEDFRAAADRLLRENPLEAWRERAASYAAGYTWDRTARAVADLYREVAST